MSTVGRTAETVVNGDESPVIVVQHEARVCLKPLAQGILGKKRPYCGVPVPKHIGWLENQREVNSHMELNAFTLGPELQARQGEAPPTHPGLEPLLH
jgi:hypothetical protein